MDEGLLYDTAATSMNMLSETELLAKAADFDESAITELYDRYESRIYHYIYRRTGEPVLAEDLTAQVFLKMLEAIRSGNAWHSSFSGWLFRIAHNMVVDHYRRRDRQNHMSIDDAPPLPEPKQNPASATQAKLDAEELRAAIYRLTEEQAQVVSLRFLEGYSINEVAEIMDKTEGAIKALQYRAVSSLRQLLPLEIWQG